MSERDAGYQLKRALTSYVVLCAEQVAIRERREILSAISTRKFSQAPVLESYERTRREILVLISGFNPGSHQYSMRRDVVEYCTRSRKGKTVSLLSDFGVYLMARLRKGFTRVLIVF